jgi:hypothetical protein
VGVGDIKPLKLLLNLRMCNAGTASERSASNKAEGGRNVPAISVEFVQDLGLQSKPGLSSATFAICMNATAHLDESAEGPPIPKSRTTFSALASRPRLHILSTSSHPMSSMTRL